MISRCSLILHNIRSVHNVGSIFRTADAAGVERIFLTGYTPTPLDRFGLSRSDFKKVSLGAENTMTWTYRKKLSEAMRELRNEEYFLIALEQDSKSTPLFDFRAPQEKAVALIVGNEVRGLSKQALRSVDAIVEIPMQGKKESLNVSVAAGIALFALLQK